MMTDSELFDLVVVGGGAAGFFGAIRAGEKNPGFRIIILEKSTKLLTKVKVSGGGRCNVTHNCFNPFRLAEHYPRGVRPLKELFKNFQASDMVTWLESKGVDLKTEQDGRMFPVSDRSQTIIDCFLREALAHKIETELTAGVDGVIFKEGRFEIHCSNGSTYWGKKILVSIGGSPHPAAYDWLSKLGHTIISPIPSLFTFNDTSKTFADLMGVSVKNGEVKISGTRFSQKGPILITHWGLSGPAIIKLSAWAAEHLFREKYNFKVLINWIDAAKEEDVRFTLLDQKTKKPKQKVLTNPLFSLPLRLWEKLCVLSDIDVQKVYGELSNKNLNKLIENLYRCPFAIQGKTTYKEEFVTCGGVDLKEVNPETMESTKVPGMYFAGEVLNIDGETGGFNFQAAWTTAYIAAQSL
jgi:predicted Rossmann fold flavoprotein